jgi:hypothetical protein
MEDIIDLVATDASPSDISGRIKEVLFAKASERLDALRPEVAASMFDANNPEESEEE